MCRVDGRSSLVLTFCFEVSKQDVERADRAQKISLALQELEVERKQMDAYHQELEEETEVARKLQALCADMEANLDLQPAEELRFALVKEEALLATAEERLSTVLAKPNPAKASRRETFLRGAEEITQESVRQAQVLASRAERHLEDAFCRACATAASTKALSSVRVRSRNAWDSEVARLIETLQEVEDISAQLLEHQRDAKEVAVLRHSVSSELHAGFLPLKREPREALSSELEGHASKLWRDKAPLDLMT
ncbi:unnamed protein product [Durusdinium trenchii]|uniref:Uncharacterized protein n=1 Tax=Durusdinium trenchii TaxID=1381693 RepID=A0ABP0LG66_9DINO